MPQVTICVLTFGDHPWLARQVIESIRTHCARDDYQLVVGANAVGNETRDYLDARCAAGDVDRLFDSTVNLNKCPMMRRMFESVDTEFIWWFDDDSHITTPDAFAHWLKPATIAPASTVMWGQAACCSGLAAFTDLADATHFVRQGSWYRGLPPPSWHLGGKGEFNFDNRGTGDGRWDFIVGGCWLVRASAIRDLDWPDQRLTKLGDDVFLGEAIRQQGWKIENIGSPGVAINTAPRRGQAGSNVTPRLSRSGLLA